MQNTPIPKSELEDDLKPEYDFSHQSPHPNRFAKRGNKKTMVVALDEEITRVFKTPEDVVKVLRALVESLPKAS